MNKGYLIIIFLLFLSSTVYSDAFYVKRPLFYGTMLDIRSHNPIFYFPANKIEDIKAGKLVEMPRDKLESYFNTVEVFSESFLFNIQNKELSNVVNQGQIKSSDNEIYTFFLNNCFAFLANFDDEIFLIHGHPKDHPNFPKDLKKVKELISKEGGIFYLITPDADDLLNLFKTKQEIFVYESIPQTVSSLKAVKTNSSIEIYMESHLNAGVNFSHYEKLQAHMPWGPLEKVTFSKIYNEKL